MMSGRAPGPLDSRSPSLSGATAPTEAEGQYIVVRDLGQAAGAIAPGQRERILGVYRAHLQALHRYRPESWLDESVFVTVFQAELSARIPSVPANGWPSSSWERSSSAVSRRPACWPSAGERPR
jgi:hypothetical protein